MTPPSHLEGAGKGEGRKAEPEAFPVSSASMGLAPALIDGRRAWSRDELLAEAAQLATTLTARHSRVLATLLDNSAAWVIADLAADQAGVVHVPLPLFFTPQQIGHALATAGVDTLMTAPDIAARWPQAPATRCVLGGASVALVATAPPGLAPVTMPPGTSKITFTSGTTGAPKGVCLSREAMSRVVQGIAQALAPIGVHRHLCALPLAVLLENMAGLAAPWSVGATCIVPSLAELGWQGSSSFDVARFHAAVQQHQPHSLILLPQMLAAWTAHLHATGQRAPACLRFVAVGGAAVGARAIALARAAGIPAFEGYGLSEGASVQTLNLPDADRPGSVGRPLPHARVRVAADGEIEVGGALFDGYLGDTPADASTGDAWWPTGDLGHIDPDGFVHVQGRKKHVLITAFGRNVSPEWVEGALHDTGAIAQAVVLGDGQPQLGAVLWPRRADTDDATLADAVARANAQLPDYARVGHWVRALAPFDPASGMATANGRARRAEVELRHRAALDEAAVAMH
jgi:long-chain acyl-CoA synthetase